MKTSLKIATLFLIAAPTIASAQSYQNGVPSFSQPQGTTPNQYYQPQMQQIQPQPQSGWDQVGRAGSSGYQQPQQAIIAPVYPGAGAPQSVPGDQNQY